MKKLIILILFTVIVTNAQDSEPNAWKFRWGYSNDIREFEPDTIKQKSILTGFQSGGSTQMNDALILI
jgi:hypothetical protein